MGLRGLFKKKSSGPKKPKFTRLFYATDIHGSEVAYRKMLNAAKGYDTNLLVLGGDVTGKFLIPVITSPDGSKRVTLHGQKRQIKSEQDMDDLVTSLGVLGYYHVEMTEEKFSALQQDEDQIDEIFHQEQYNRLAEWIK